MERGLGPLEHKAQTHLHSEVQDLHIDAHALERDAAAVACRRQELKRERAELRIAVPALARHSWVMTASLSERTRELEREELHVLRVRPKLKGV